MNSERPACRNREPESRVVHHDEHALMNLEGWLEFHGFDTTTAWNTEQAVVALDHSSFDAVLIGDRPPLITATEIIWRGWARHGDPRNAFIVAAGDRGFERACLNQLSANCHRVQQPLFSASPALPTLAANGSED